MAQTLTPRETCIARKRARSCSTSSSIEIPLRNTEPDHKRIKLTQDLYEPSIENLNSTCFESSTAFPDDSSQRRRVNPDSLARRLGQEVVRDMDALILPGATEMPSFALRKELQLRHNIDRRHLYDYFHSKGLRVVKEDRYCNLTKKRNPAIVPRERPLKPKPLTCSNSSYLLTIGATENRAPTKRVVTKLPKRRSKPVAPLIFKELERVTPDASEDSSQIRCSVEPPCPSVLPVFEELDAFPLSVCSEPACVELNQYAPEGSCSCLALSACDSTLEYEYLQSISPYESSTAEVFFSLDNYSMDQDLQSEAGRVTFYNLLGDKLGPACGFQESVGTYKMQMAERSRLYFDHLLRNRRTLGQNFAKEKLHSGPQPRPDVVDFRKWLLFGQYEGASLHSSLSLQTKPIEGFSSAIELPPTPDLRSRCWVAESPMQEGLVDHLFLFTESGRPVTLTLDDMFPKPLLSDDYQDTSMSPVTRTTASIRQRELEGRERSVMVHDPTPALHPTDVVPSTSTPLLMRSRAHAPRLFYQPRQVTRTPLVPSCLPRVLSRSQTLLDNASQGIIQKGPLLLPLSYEEKGATIIADRQYSGYSRAVYTVQ